MTQHTTIDATVRNAAIRILANGDATMAEVALMIGASRQRVRYWAQEIGVSDATRRARLVQLWHDALLVGRVTAEAKAAGRGRFALLPKRKRGATPG